MILLKCSNMVLGNTIVDVKGLSESVDVERFFSEEIDDASPVDSASRACQDIPEETLPRGFRRGT